MKKDRVAKRLRIWCTYSVLALSLSCGNAADAVVAEVSDPAVLAAQSRAAHLILQLSQLEIDAIELSRLTLHRSHTKAFKDKARDIIAAHQTLLTALGQVASLSKLRVARSMDTFGQQAYSALSQKSDGHFERHLYVVQRDLRTRAEDLFELALARSQSDALQNYLLQAQRIWKQ
jgi:predicted outer membrane protein